MAYTYNLTQKGQVTIPKEIRKHLKLKFSDKVFFIKDKNNVILAPANNFLNLEGSIKTKVEYSDPLADEHVSKYISGGYEEATNS